MPKSKEQKHFEAIERARKNIPKERLEMLRYQVGGDIYHSNLMMSGYHYANEQARKMMKEFQVKCEAAHVDTHGNPL